MGLRVVDIHELKEMYTWIAYSRPAISAAPISSDSTNQGSKMYLGEKKIHTLQKIAHNLLLQITDPPAISQISLQHSRPIGVITQFTPFYRIL